MTARTDAASGESPEIGAIFMASRRTMDECFARRLFGLPSSPDGFVGEVRAGMVLFLFEYENRSLHGVFRATSDGAMDIVPLAYASSGNLYPAQVRFERVWECETLREVEFRDAIRENYYQKSKFHFGLSQDQVSKLLWLFNSRRIKAATFRDLSSEKSRSGDAEKERSTFQRKLSFETSVSTRKQPETSPSDETIEDKARGSRYSGESGASISSFECESGPNAFSKGSGPTAFEEGLEKSKCPGKKESPGNDDMESVAFEHVKELDEDPSKVISANLGDFIPLGSLDNPGRETESTRNDQIEHVAFESLKKLEDPCKAVSIDLGDFIPLDSLDNPDHEMVSTGNDQTESVAFGAVENETTVDLGDFIPLPASPDNDVNETESLGNDQIAFIPLEQYVPLRLISCEHAANEITRDSSQEDSNQKLDVLDNKAGHLCIKGLYSDEADRSSVFSRLNFDSKVKRRGSDESTKEVKLVQKRKEAPKWMHGNKQKSVFSRLSITSKVMEYINDTVTDQRRNTVKETEIASRDREEDSESARMKRDDEEKAKGNDTVQDIMDTLLQIHPKWKKTNARYNDPEPDDVKTAAKKDVFSRLSWDSASIHWDNNAVTVRLPQGCDPGYDRVRDARFSFQDRSGYCGKNKPAERWSDTLPMKRTRDSEVSNPNYEATEESFENYANISKLLKSQAQTEHVNGSGSEPRYEERPRKKLTRPSFAKTTNSESCLGAQIPLEESCTCKQSSESFEIPVEEKIVGDDKTACLEEEDEAKLIVLESKSEDELVEGFKAEGCAVTMPLKTYQRRARRVYVYPNSV